MAAFTFNVLGDTYDTLGEPAFFTTGSPWCYNKVRRQWVKFYSLQDAMDRALATPKPNGDPGTHPNGTQEWSINEFGVPSDGWIAEHMPHQEFSEGFGPGITPVPPIPGITPEPGEIEDGGVAMRWQSSYVTGATYKPGDVVQDDGWNMVCIRETDDRPAPQAQGDPSKDMPDSPTFGINQNEGVAWTGHTYTFTTGGWLKAVEIYVPALDADITYRIMLANQTDPENPVVSYVLDPLLIADDWASVGVANAAVPPGTVLTLVIDALNSGSSTTIVGGWRVGTSSNNMDPEDAPNLAQWDRKKHERFNFSAEDLDGTRRVTEMMGVIAGSTIQITQTTNPANSWTMLVQAPPTAFPEGEWPANPDNVTHISFETERIENTGDPVNFTATNCTFDVPVAAATDFSEQPDGSVGNQPTWATVEGRKKLSGTEDPAANVNSYGARLEFQPAYWSPDWEFVSKSDPN